MTDHPHRIWRHSIGATLAQVAALVGYSAPTIHRWERRVSQPDQFLNDKWIAALKTLEAKMRERLAEAKGGIGR